MSDLEPTPDAAEGWPESPLLAEAVEKVPGVRFLETLIQSPGRF